jgi:hypothetical protein
MDSEIIVATDVLFQALGDEAILLHLPTERYFGLNDVGMYVWQHLESGGDLESCIIQIAAEYDAPESVIRQDVTDLIEQLVDRELLKVAA